MIEEDFGKVFAMLYPKFRGFHELLDRLGILAKNEIKILFLLR